jgi:molybdenum cofactor cytidylyltransferase
MQEYNRKKTIAALILAAGRSSRMQHGQESYHKLLLPLGQGTVLSHVIAATLASQARPIILILGYQSAQIRASLTRTGTSPTPTTGDKSHPYINILPDTAYHDIIITENTAYAQGMSTSLHQGIQTLINQNNYLRKGTSTGDGHRKGANSARPSSTQRGADTEHPTSTRRDVDDELASSRPLRSPSPATQCDGALVLLGDQPLITPALLNQLIEMKYSTGKRIIAPFYNSKRGNPVLFDADLFPELLTITGDEGARSVIEKHRAEVEMLDVDDAQSWYDVDTWEAYQKVLHIWQQQHK